MTEAGWEKRRSELVKDLGRILVKTNALQFGTFTLTSGKLSSYYIDLRVVPSFPAIFRKVIEAFVELIDNSVGRDRFDAVCGIPTAGLPYASTVAYSLEKPLLYVRKERKMHGTSKNVEGVVNLGWRVLILDDLVTTGSSLISAGESVRIEGGVVEDAVVLIDRMEGGERNLSEKGIRLHSLAKIDVLASLLYETNIIDETLMAAIQRQIKSEESQAASP